MKVSKRKHVLPIGRTASMVLQLNTLRAQCCEAAKIIATNKPLNEADLEECAKLDDALAQAQRLLKGTVARMIISRLNRRIKAK